MGRGRSPSWTSRPLSNRVSRGLYIFHCASQTILTTGTPLTYSARVAPPQRQLPERPSDSRLLSRFPGIEYICVCFRLAFCSPAPRSHCIPREQEIVVVRPAVEQASREELFRLPSRWLLNSEQTWVRFSPYGTGTRCMIVRSSHPRPAVRRSSLVTTAAVLLIMLQPPTNDIFLVIYSSRLFPSHWGVLVPSSEGSGTGTLINVIGDPSVGFEHEFKRDYGGEDTRRVSKTLLLGKVASEHIDNRKEVGQNTDDVPNNKLEDVALSIPPPSKSLRRSGSSVSFFIAVYF